MSFDELDFDLVVDLYEMAFESEGVELWIVVIHIKRRVKVDAGVENKRMWCSVCVEVGGKKFKKKRRNHEILQFGDFVEEEVAGLLLPFL